MQTCGLIALPASSLVLSNNMLLKLVNLLSLAIALSSLRALGSPASIIQGRDSLEYQWNVIYQRVGKNGVQQLYQGILPHATTTKTGTCRLFRFGQARYLPIASSHHHLCNSYHSDGDSVHDGSRVRLYDYNRSRRGKSTGLTFIFSHH
jgi:hypothetical protein